MSQIPHENVTLTPAEAALFSRIHFHACPVSDLPDTWEEGRSGRGPTAAGASPLAVCLAKGWLQVIDEAALATIVQDVRAAGLIGPIYGLPKLGDVDFTPGGAALWQNQGNPRHPSERPYPIVVHAKSSHYCRTKEAALGTIKDLREYNNVDSISGPFEIGPWRAQWWRRFLAGYRIDCEWHGHGHDVTIVNDGGISIAPRFPQAQVELQRLEHILDLHKVTRAQWLLLATMDTGLATYTTRFPRIVADIACGWFGITISEEECRTALQECLCLGWLTRAEFDPADPTRQTIARETLDRIGEVKTLLRDEPAIMPIPWTWALRAIHFTPSGAARYRMLATAWLGAAWEDEIQVCQHCYREEHHYCETEEGMQATLQQYSCRQENVLTSKVVPIGPWCVHWWQRFPQGYRVEFQLGDPEMNGKIDSDPVKD